MQKTIFRPRPWGPWLAWAGAALAALALAQRLGRMISYPLPHYEAESAMAWSTHLLLQGLSPWSWSSYPAAINVYGIGYPALCAPFAWIFGTGLPVLRGVSVLCLAAAAALVYVLGRRYGREPLICAWAALACAAAWSVNITATARPDALAVLLYLAALACVEKKEATASDGLWAAALAVAAFFVKPYGILAWPLATAALLIRGQAALAAWHCLAVLLFFAAGAAWVRQGHPLYFEEVFLNNLNIAGHSLAHRAAQWRALAPECGGLLLLWGLGLQGPQGLALKAWLRAPWVLAFLLSALAFHFKLSLHSGATLTYFYQLCLPLLLLACLAQAPSRKGWLPAALALLCVSLAWRLAAAPYGPAAAEKAGAEALQQALAPHLHPAGNGHAAALLWPQGSVVFDYGQAEFAHYSEADHGWPRLFPNGPALQARRQRFDAAWSAAIRHKAFGVLALGAQGAAEEASLKAAYQARLQAKLWSPQVPYQIFTLTLYRPRPLNQPSAGTLE